MDIKGFLRSFFRSANNLNEGEYAADEWEEEKRRKEKENLTNKRFSGRFRSPLINEFREFFTSYSFVAITSIAIFCVVLAVPLPGPISPERALYSMHNELTPAAISPQGDFIDALKIYGTVTSEGKLEVREEFILYARHAAAKYPLRRDLSTLSVNMPTPGREMIPFSITPRSFEIAKRSDEEATPEGGPKFIPLGGLGELDVRPRNLATSATFGKNSPGEGIYRYIFEYSVDNFLVLSEEQGAVFFEIGQRFNIPINRGEVRIDFGEYLLPRDRLRVGPVVVKEYGNTKNVIPVSYVSLARLNPPLAGFKRGEKGGYQLWANFPNGIAKHSSVAIDFSLRHGGSQGMLATSGNDYGDTK